MDLMKSLKNCFSSSLEVSALEAFAREGDWFTEGIMTVSTELTCIEINSFYIQKLAERFPNANIFNDDAHKVLDSISNCGARFDLISLDNPQGLYCDEKYCEHFDVLPLAIKNLRSQGVLLFNVNLKPYDDRITLKEKNDNYGNNFEKWIERRAEYYGEDNDLNVEFIMKFYKKILAQHGRALRSFDSFNLDGSKFQQSKENNIIRAVLRFE